MKKIISVFILFLIIYNIQAQTIPIEKWKTAYEKNVSIVDITYDSEGNIYSIGNFYHNNDLTPIDFDSGEKVVNLTSFGGYDVFITKQDPLGNLLWVKQIGGTDHDVAKNIVIGSTGEIYVLGNFWSQNMDFDPGDGEYLMSGSSLTTTLFMIKLTNEGEFIWVKKWKFWFAILKGMNIDYDDNVYLNGYYSGAVDFDPNDGQVNHTTESMENDAFILKINAEGNFLWVNTYSDNKEDNLSVNFINKLEFDADNNIYTAAYVEQNNSVDFDLSENDYLVNTTDSGNSVIIKLSKNGDFLWGNKSNDGLSITKIKIDKSRNLSLFGMFNNSIDLNFEGISQSLKTTGNSRNICILKVNNLGKVISVQTLPETQTEGSLIYASDYDLDAAGNIYFAGSYQGAINFSLNAIPHMYESSANKFASNSYLVKYSPEGEFVWFKTLDEYFITLNFVVDSIFGNILINGTDTKYIIYDDNNFTSVSTSSLVKIEYCTLPEEPVVSNVTATCAGDEVVLHASGKGTLGWYTKSTGGKHIAAGPDFSFILKKDTVFYVQDSTCHASTSRIAVSIKATDCSVTSVSGNKFLSDLKIYPNPTSNRLFIESSDVIDKIILTDLMGRIQIETTNVNAIDLSDLTNGIYYITLTNGSNSNTQKIIKY